MLLTERMDGFGKLGWIAAVVFGFWWFWPVGLALLAFLACSGRLRAWRQCGGGRWYNTAQPGQPWGQQPGGLSHGWQPPWGQGGCGWGRRNAAPPPSGNRAFDEYRAETLRRLEEEQKEFLDYLERLRQAKDKAEFDQFMAERSRRPEAPPSMN